MEMYRRTVVFFDNTTRKPVMALRFDTLVGDNLYDTLRYMAVYQEKRNTMKHQIIDSVLTHMRMGLCNADVPFYKAAYQTQPPVPNSTEEDVAISDAMIEAFTNETDELIYVPVMYHEQEYQFGRVTTKKAYTPVQA